jgi:hypothetical protein
MIAQRIYSIALGSEDLNDQQTLHYIFGIGRNKVLEREVDPLMKQAEAAFVETGQQQRLFA